MKNYICAIIGVVSLSVAGPAMTAQINYNPGDLAARIEVIPFQTLTLSDQQAQIEPCRGYFKGLVGRGRDVKMTEFPNTWHLFDHSDRANVHVD